LARMMEKRNEVRMLMGKPEIRKPLRRPKHRWEKILKCIVEETRMRWTPLL
jgi:hypothetical protein